MKILIKILIFSFINFPDMVIFGQETNVLSDSQVKPVEIYSDNERNQCLFIRNGINKRDSLPEMENTKYQELKHNELLDSLKKKNFKSKWMRELTNIIILSPDSTKEKDTLTTRRSETYLLQYDGCQIRNISYIKLNVFGPNVFDSATTSSVGWFERTVNNLHIKTTDKVLERHLLFKSGDIIDSRIISDNERILRELPFIQDARIMIKPVKGFKAYADIIIIIKDRASKAFYPDLSDIDIGKLEIWDKNIFGSGNEFQTNIHWNKDKSGMWGLESIFYNRNIYGSFIDGKVEYHNVFDYESYGLQFNRKFFTPNTKYAGGALLCRTSTVRTINYNTFSEERVPVKSNKYDVWIGRAVLLNKNASIEKNRLNLIIATRLYEEYYFERPDVTPRSFYEYHDKTLWLNSIALSSQSFYKSSLIYSYGRTEDIPTGYLVSITGGPEFGEFRNRFYSSISLSAGYYLSNLGYLYGYITDGGFFSGDQDFEQGMYQFRLNYFTNLFVFKRFKYRQFISFNLVHGIKRFDYESINLDNKNGIRGFKESTVFGTKKMVLNLETVVFTPYYFWGFRFVTFGFCDIGKIGSENDNILTANNYSGLGLGFRIQNERLVFPTFELRFAFYPQLPRLPFDEIVSLTGEKRLNPSNFYYDNPAILNFK